MKYVHNKLSKIDSHIAASWNIDHIWYHIDAICKSSPSTNLPSGVNALGEEPVHSKTPSHSCSAHKTDYCLARNALLFLTRRKAF